MKCRHFIIAIIGIIVILIFYYIFRENELIKLLTLSQTLFSFITLIIAIILFDRYQAGSKLNDKTIDVVIKYIEFLQKQSFIVENCTYNGIKTTKTGISILDFRKKYTYYGEVKTKIFIPFGAYLSFYTKLQKFIDSPWMPIEIRDASEFFFLNKNVLENHSLNSIKENCQILIYCDSDNDDHSDLITFDNVDSIKELQQNIENLMASIEKWIKKQASDINCNLL